MTPVWEKDMIDQSAKELLDLLGSRARPRPMDSIRAVDCFTEVAQGKHGEFAERGFSIHYAIESHFNAAMSLIAPPETILREDFWDTPAGQLLTCVQYWLYGRDTLSVSEAAKAIYGKADNGAISATLRLIERGKLKAIRKPEQVYTNRRTTTKTGQGTNRSRLVLNSSLTEYLNSRG